MKFALLLVLVASWTLPAWSADSPDADAGYSPWMSSEALTQWKKENVKGRRLFCPTIEGRLNNGAPEFRVKPVPAPSGYNFMVFTFRNLEENVYQARVAQYSKMAGFEQTCSQSFVDAQGVKRYQAVFVKLTKKTGGIGEEAPANAAPPAPSDSMGQ